MAGGRKHEGPAVKVGIVTSFPEPNVVKSAIAYYSQTILDPLRDGGDEFVIFADANRGERLGACERYASNVTVKRCWRYGYFAPFQILGALLRDRVDVIHLEYDVYFYGGVVAALLLPLVLRLVRALHGTRIVSTLHGVVSQRVVTREMLRENGFVLPYSGIGRLGFYTIYALFNWASDRIVVLEVKLAEILESEYGVPRAKLYVCPIPLMHEGPRPSLVEARARCGIGDGKVVLFFGYASYYKGIDVLLDAFPAAREVFGDMALHIVAGRHPRLRGNPRYEDVLRRIAREGRGRRCGHARVRPRSRSFRTISPPPTSSSSRTRRRTVRAPRSTPYSPRENPSWSRRSRSSRARSNASVRAGVASLCARDRRIF